jgi:hypothetical protein
MHLRQTAILIYVEVWFTQSAVAIAAFASSILVLG